MNASIKIEIIHIDYKPTHTNGDKFENIMLKKCKGGKEKYAND